jgi:hypothetical protein
MFLMEVTGYIFNQVIKYGYKIAGTALKNLDEVINRLKKLFVLIIQCFHMNAIDRIPFDAL